MKKEFLGTYQMLERYHPTYPEEIYSKEKMLQLLATCEDSFSIRCRVGHFTASAFLLNKNKTHACLMHHVKLDMWLQLGGHCEGDTDILSVAMKEAKEESGITAVRPVSPEIFDIDIHLIPPYGQEEAHYHFDIRFLLHAYQDDTLKKNHESHQLRWIEKNDESPFCRKLSKDVQRLFEKWRNRQ